MILPIPLLVGFLVGLTSLTLLAFGVYLLYRAARRCIRYDLVRRSDLDIHPERGADVVPVRHVVTLNEALHSSAILTPLVTGLALMLLTFGGRHLVKMAFPAGNDEPQALRTGSPSEVSGSDGTKIHVELYGLADGPILVFTHGWGTNSTEWYYAKRQLADRFRLVLWDLPGLGESNQPEDRNFALERMAAHLHSVLSVVNGKPVVLVGHSIGGMINLTFCRLYPELLGTQIAGIAQLDTSYTNPVRTTKGAAFSLSIQKPIAEPILHAMVYLSPLVRLTNWLSYENGLLYLENAQSSFAGSETRGQLDLVSRYQFESSPAVVARGTLAMFHWDASPVLPRVNTPVLILVGKQDTTTLPSASEHMQMTMPRASLQTVDPSAHYGLLEQNITYDAAVAQFALACLKR